jgi:hypothetical protein
MTRSPKIQYFDAEGRENLPNVIKCIKSYLRDRENQGLSEPIKIVFLTREGEGPMYAYNQIRGESIRIIAVTFPRDYRGTKDDQPYVPEIAERVRKFFTGVEIPIITNRLPFDDIIGCDAHNREMSLIRDTLGLLGGSVPLAIQAVLQAVDSGHVNTGELVIAATGDTALLVRASTTKLFLAKDDRGLIISEILCKPRDFSITRKPKAALPKSTAPAIEGETVRSGETSLSKSESLSDDDIPF